MICVRATREPALLTSARLVAPDHQGGDSCSMSSDADSEAAGRRGGERFPVAVLPAEDGGDAEYVRLGRRAVDGHDGVLERHGIREVAARPGGEDLVFVRRAVRERRSEPAGAVKQRLRRRSAARAGELAHSGRQWLERSQRLDRAGPAGWTMRTADRR